MDTDPTDEDVVEVASSAAEGIILDRYSTSALRDFDVTIRFESGTLDIDIYINPPADSDHDPEEVIEEAITAAEAAVDELFETA